jgi:hypothetical protein
MASLLDLGASMLTGAGGLGGMMGGTPSSATQTATTTISMGGDTQTTGNQVVLWVLGGLAALWILKEVLHVK